MPIRVEKSWRAFSSRYRARRQNNDETTKKELLIVGRQLGTWFPDEALALVDDKIFPRTIRHTERN